MENLKYCKKALELKKEIEASFIKLGEYLYEIKNKNLFLPQWSSWEEYYMELKMSQNTVNKLIQIYETFILKYNLPPENVVSAGGWSVIAEILPVINSKKDAEEWLHKSTELSRSDLRKELKEEVTGVQMASCKHRNTYTITVCRDCGIKMEDHKDHD